MKTIITTLLLLSSSYSFAGEKTCAEIKKDMDLLCGVVAEQCQFIKSCLHRRDTCVEKEPQTQQECLRLNKCMDKIANRLPVRERCKYRWAETETSKFCRVDPAWNFREEGCPGEVDANLFKLIAYGLSANVDGEFTCKASTVMYRKKVESCERQRAKFKECMNPNYAGDSVAYSESKPKKCDVYTDFDKIPAGTHFISVEGIEEVTSNRGFQGAGDGGSADKDRGSRRNSARGE